MCFRECSQKFLNFPNSFLVVQSFLNFRMSSTRFLINQFLIKESSGLESLLGTYCCG